MKILPLSTALLLWCSLALPAYAEAGVVASIKPVHSLVASVMGDTGTPALLVEGNQSPHGFALKPSQVEALQKARVVFYIDAHFETFLARALTTLPAGVRTIALADAPGMILLPTREGGNWDAHDHHHHHHHDHGHEHAATDPHVWLSPKNAVVMTRAIATTLSEAYPEHKDAYARNADATIAAIQALDAKLKTQLAPYKNTPYIVFHNAFHYFEQAYGLSAAGSITPEPEQAPGAKRISDVRAKIKALHVTCVFAEPQFDSRLAATVTEGTDAKTGVLDEHGFNIGAGAELYGLLMQRIANGFQSCLSKQ